MDLIKRKYELRNKIQTLEWDKKHRQIHYAQERKLKEYKKELEEIEEKLKSMEHS